VLRRILLVVGIVLLLPIVALGALFLVAQSEWGERWVERQVAQRLDREVDIEGISVQLGWPPGLVFARLRIGNPAWAATPNLIDAEGLYARVHVPPLLRGKVVVPYLGANVATSGLELDGARATWRFGPASDEESALQLGLVYLRDGHIRFIDAREKTDLEIDVKGSAGEGGELNAEGRGRFRGDAVTAKVRIPGLDPQHEAPLTIDGEARVGRTTAAAKGTLATDGKTLDLELDLAGQTLKELGKVTGIVFPDSPPYKVKGRLRHQGSDWVFDPFRGSVGESDIAGAFTYAKGAARPFVKANLRSKLLDFDDLGPLIGAPPKTKEGEAAAPEQRAQAAKREAAKRILPEREFGTEAWGKMDADVRLVAERVQRPKQLPLEKLSTHLVLKDSVLRLQPLDFTLAGGRLTTEVTLDARAKPLQGHLKADVQGLKLARLFPQVETMKEALGTLYGRTELKGTGRSVAALLGTSAGKASFAIDGGRISALLVELIGLDGAEAVMLLGRKHEQVQLRCAVSGFEVKDGVAEAQSFVVDTDDTVIEVQGRINLDEETLDLQAKPYPKDMSPLALRTPLNLTGPLREPKIRPKPGPIAARAAAGAVLAAINPALAALALIETGPGKDAPCGQLLAEARQKGAVKKAK
jgi:AsmA family protein